MKYNNIKVINENSIRTIIINREKQLNSLNSTTIKELNNAIILAEEDSSTKCIIITGSGKKAFIAGADIKEFASFNSQKGEELARLGQKMLFDLLDNLKTPSIAAINGFALGGGLELAMACHIRIASNEAKMGLPEVSLGVIPGYGGTQRLAQLVGKGKAMEMILTAQMVSSEEAVKFGLVNKVVFSNDLLSEATKIANKIISNSPLAISKAIKSVNSGFIDGVDGFEVEKKEFGSCFQTQDFTEGVSAFIEKRKPNFN